MQLFESVKVLRNRMKVHFKEICHLLLYITRNLALKWLFLSYARQSFELYKVEYSNNIAVA